MTTAPPGPLAALTDRLLARVYAAILRAYPPDFRRRHADEMRQAFADGGREQVAGSRPLKSLRFLCREIIGGIRSGLRERRRAREARSRIRPANQDLARRPKRGPLAGRLADDLRADLHLAFRSLAREPLFAAAAMGTLALGIGASVTVFGLYNSLVARPLPGLSAPEGLVRVLFHGERPYNFHRVSAPNFEDLTAAAEPFESTTAYRAYPANVTIADAEPFSANLEMVQENYFAMLRVPMQLGRAFTTHETTDPAAGRVVVLTDHAWKTRFGADPEVLGRTLQINRRDYRIVGVGAPAFRGLERYRLAEMWVPASVYGDLAHFIDVSPDFLQQRELRLFEVMVGRLRADATARQAERALQSTFAALIDEYPELNRRAQGYAPVVHADIGENVSFTSEGLRSVFRLLAGAVALVLLIATANVANLLFSRSLNRRGEVAVRQALGASSGRLYRQFLTESTVLGLAASVLAVPLSAVITRQIQISELGYRLPPEAGVAFDGRVILFTLMVAIGAGLAAGAASKTGARDANLAACLRSALAWQGARPRRLRDALTVAQIAASMAVLVAAVLLVRSLHGLRVEDKGFEPAVVTSVSYDLFGHQYRGAEIDTFFQQIGSGLDSLRPSIEYAFAVPTPYTGTSTFTRVLGHADAATPAEGDAMYSLVFVSRGYFATLGLPVLRGATFSEPTAGDGETVRMETIVSQSLARQLFGDSDALGREIQVQTGREYSTFRIVGVVADAHFNAGLDDAAEQIYLPLEHDPFGGSATLLVRPLIGEPVAAVRDLIRAFDPTLPLRITTLGERFETRIAATRALTEMVAILATIALILAAVGLHATIMFSVIERTRDLGIRLALGATSSRVVGLVVRRSARVAVVGVALGGLLAWALSSALASQLYGVAATDAATYALSAAALLVLALLACLRPARHVSDLDPLIAIRAR